MLPHAIGVLRRDVDARVVRSCSDERVGVVTGAATEFQDLLALKRVEGHNLRQPRLFPIRTALKDGLEELAAAGLESLPERGTSWA